MAYNVLITCPQLMKTVDQYRPMFANHDVEIALPEMEQQLSEVKLLEIIDQYDGVIAGDDPFTARVLEKGTLLKTVARWGVGVDGVDLDAAKRLGISVTNTPGVFSDEVADVVMGYVILLARGLHKLDTSIRDGGWLKISGTTLAGKTIGVVGVGNIGRAVVDRSIAFGMKPLGYDVYPPPTDFVERTGTKMVGLDELLASADFISLNCNLTPENRRMLGADQFASMKDGVFIVNCSRGALIDESALVEFLGSGKIAGAGLDSFENEPLPLDSELRRFDNCIFGTHNGSNTIEAVLRVNELTIANLFRGLGIATEE